MRERHVAGAEIVADADTVFGRAELVVKVKEPIGEERTKLHRGQVLFTYLHLAPDRALTQALIASVVTAIAYETATSPQGALPLLTRCRRSPAAWSAAKSGDGRATSRKKSQATGIASCKSVPLLVRQVQVTS